MHHDFIVRPLRGSTYTKRIQTVVVAACHITHITVIQYAINTDNTANNNNEFSLRTSHNYFHDHLVEQGVVVYNTYANRDHLPAPYVVG